MSLLFAIVHLGHLLVLANNANWLFAKLMFLGAVFFAKLPGACFIWQGSVLPSDSSSTEITVLNLPYGEAAVHIRDGPEHWLLDTGTKRSFGRIVQPLLQEKGTDTLSGMVLTHSDIEHVGGAIRAFNEHACRLACLGTLEPWRHESGLSGLKRFLATQRAHPEGLRFLKLGDEIRLGSRTTATVLHPSPADLHDRADDRALVFLVNLQGFRVLFCTDIGFIAEKKIMERHLLKHLRCDVLIRNQHASDYSALPEFLLAARPRIIITSNAPFIAEEVMPPSLAEYAKKRKAALFDQDVHGAVSLHVTGDRLTATSFVTGESVTLEPRR